jgi:hypothetical protein
MPPRCPRRNATVVVSPLSMMRFSATLRVGQPRPRPPSQNQQPIDLGMAAAAAVVLRPPWRRGLSAGAHISMTRGFGVADRIVAHDRTRSRPSVTSHKRAPTWSSHAHALDLACTELRSAASANGSRVFLEKGN